MLFEYFKAIIYGILEGITEWLPISSTGHLVLLEALLSFNSTLLFGADSELFSYYMAAFNTVIQLGAVLAVFYVYIHRLVPQKYNNKEVCTLWIKLLLSTAPAAVFGLLADFFSERLFGCELDVLLFRPTVIAAALISYGFLFVIVEKLTKSSTSLPSSPYNISYGKAFAIGCFQALAIIPGTSRSGATILGARILGVPRVSASEFSFLMALPVIFSASALETLDFLQYLSASKSNLPTNAIIILLVAAVTAFFVSVAAIKFLTDFVKKHTFIPFGIYRIALGVAVLFFL